MEVILTNSLPDPTFRFQNADAGAVPIFFNLIVIIQLLSIMGFLGGWEIKSTRFRLGNFSRHR
jgi:hypothetical protein